MLYWIGWFLCRMTLKFFGRMQSIGGENVPKKGGVILAPNHVSYMDPPAAGGALTTRPVRFMAKIELFKIPILGFLIRKVGSFPVKQGAADRTALRKAMELIEKGEVVCIFPEGTRSPDGNLMEAHAGIGMVALKTKAPIVPVAIIGTDKVLPPHSFFFHFSRVKVVYGKPITFDDLYETGGKDAIEEVGKRVMSEIARLKADNE